ncbi:MULTISPECIES: hypothetical protein [Bacteroides]|uniref:hypothetical protein n=1 Tax=Bacteroides TaxID=816 RepID=UPI001D7E87AD|nr:MULTISPECIES: hypothetical protein [Bacteroides]HJD93053.1 hypothetical protein [Bacteroides coprosuis]
MSDLLNKLTGKQALQDRKLAKEIKKTAQHKIDEYVTHTENLNAELNSAIENLAQVKLSALQDTLAHFLSLLRDLQENNPEAYRQLLKEIELDDASMARLILMDMKVHDISEAPLNKVAIATVACIGVPAFVKGAVDTYAVATSGTTLSSLAGSTDIHSILSYLVGGGILSTATLAATGALAIVSAGLLASQHYSNKLSKATEFKIEVDEACEKMEQSWGTMGEIKNLVCKASAVLSAIHQESKKELNYFEPIIPDFEVEHHYHLQRFKDMARWIKMMGLLAKTPLFDNQMNINKETDELLNQTEESLGVVAF